MQKSIVCLTIIKGQFQSFLNKQPIAKSLESYNNNKE